jgi:glucosylceramidase
MKINCCDHSKWSGAITYTNAINADPVAAAFVNTFTGHEYGSLPTTPLNTTKNTWMSEWASANSTAFNDSWDKTENGSNQNNGIHLANDISAALTKANVSAYVYWYADSVGLTGGFFSLTATTNNPSYVLTKRLWAIGGFARFVRPGAYRVPATTNNSNLAITAFINTNGNKVINVVNNATTIVNTNLTLDAASANATPTAYFTDENNSVAPTNIASVTGTTLSAAFAPRSMTSIVLTSAPVSGTVQLITVNTLTKFGDGSYQATVKISNTGTGTARDVQLTTAELGSTAGSTMPTAALPFTVGDIAPGASTTVTVNYPASAGTSGSPTVEKITGSYTGGVFGNGTFGGSSRVTLP